MARLGHAENVLMVRGVFVDPGIVFIDENGGRGWSGYGTGGAWHPLWFKCASTRVFYKRSIFRQEDEIFCETKSINTLKNRRKRDSQLGPIRSMSGSFSARLRTSGENDTLVE